MKEIVAILSIIGAFVGSGFVSGKEIVVFFARFGGWCYPVIFLCFFALFFLFKIMLNFSQQSIKNKKLYLIINHILGFIFCSAMMGSIINLIQINNNLIKIAIFLLIFIFCLIIFFKGGKILGKINLIVVPLMLTILLVGIFCKIEIVSLNFSFVGSAGFLYGGFYVLLNCASVFPLASELGRELGQKQKTRVAFICALVLCVLLLLCSTVLLAYPQNFLNSMPFVCLFEKGKIFVQVAVFCGSVTTLFGQVHCLGQNFRLCYKNEILNFMQAICLPFCFSLLGFNLIVSFVYPLAGLLGGVLFVDLFFIPLFKGTDKKIHSSGKKT